MKKVGIITFHASHNYGSMLQAYALQQVVKSLGNECEIINFRTDRQRGFYKPLFLRGNLFDRIKRGILYLPYLRSLLKRRDLFEAFLQNDLNLSSEEYVSEEELKAATLKYDYFISGGDQIWNPACFDFDWAYFLSFVKSGRKIAYAPSMGPSPLAIQSEDVINRIKSQLMTYDYISVREPESGEKIKMLLGRNVENVLDPTFLIESEFWNQKAGDKPLVNGKYIYVYAPSLHTEVFHYAQRLAKHFGCRIIVSQMFNSTKDNIKVRKYSIEHFLTVGPNEFLNLCKYATCLVGSSFHLIAFAILLRKSFYTVGGVTDSRISNILKIAGLTTRNISSDTHSIDFSLDIDFHKISAVISKEKEHSIKYLKQSLE
ncbi:polysaccharide pyruvyl transferase family protein [Bacteroides sp.]|uniref:polysaccharide pyruvyl transferase family protein n=1 Tax=Bacteroides sp. TaxID=29523 RepID=UPI0023CCABBF|nr:polysaccharide pyruvyl transferase family protein [Bacteroides sp.]MDE6215507.1 polysaccharide pyruvyl transferase family protein [Bacteroides sp.]